MPAPVGDRECEGGRLVGHDEIGYMSTKFQSPKAVFREQSGDHNKAEHHCEEQVKQIVAGVDGGEPDPECEEKEPGPFRCQTDRPPSGHAPHIGEDRGGVEIEEWVLHTRRSSS